jgi:hypothetical protein
MQAARSQIDTDLTVNLHDKVSIHQINNELY